MAIPWLRSFVLAALLIGSSAVLFDSPPARSEVASSNVSNRWLSFDDMVRLEDTFVRLSDEVGDSVVSVRVSRSLGQVYAADSLGDSGKQIHQALDQTIASAGSGMVIRADGLILTNEHVITGAERITVLLGDGSEWPAELVAADLRSDLAVIRIHRDRMNPVRWGDLKDVRRGQWAFAMGDPYGLAGDGQVALSVGHVSALGRELQRQLDPTNVRYYGNLIQTTADIQPGNSGGPLLSLQGRVIGINTAIQSRNGTGEGVGFAIPISQRTLSIIEKLSSGERVTYGFLGVRVRRPASDQRADESIQMAAGALVVEVTPRSPADSAGLRKGDLILEYDGVPVEGPDHLVRRVGMSEPGSTVPVRFLRDGAPQSVDTTIAERPVSGNQHSENENETVVRFEQNVA